MYLPKHFEVTDIDEVASLVARIGAADLITVDSTGLPVATLLPCIWNRTSSRESEHGSLVMHMARANSQWKSIENDARGLAIVHGAEAYISPSNYERKLTDHKVVPTWNYQSVHLSGRVEVSEDIETLRSIVTTLTQFHESGRQDPWDVSESDTTYFEAQLRGIVAVTLQVEKVEAKYKLSQNRSSQDQKSVISDLENSSASGAREIAGEMKRTFHSRG